MTIKVEINPPDTIRKMAQYPQLLEREMQQAHRDVLIILNESIPPYPTQRRESKYKRTGDLGRGLGVDMNGGRIGAASVYETHAIGQRGEFSTIFGSSQPEYNFRVIGDETQAQHMSHWWKLKSILPRANRKINEAFERAKERLVKYFE